jgi:hypothetical protein
MVVAISALSVTTSDIVGLGYPSSDVDRVEFDTWRRHNGALRTTRNKKEIKMFITAKRLPSLIRTIQFIFISKKVKNVVALFTLE